MKKYILLFIALCLIPVLSEAQDIVDLKKCIETALENNYSLKITRNTSEIADNNVSYANAGYLPVVSADASYSGTLNNTDQELSSGDKTSSSGVHNQTYNVGANLTWNIFKGLQVKTTYGKLKELRSIGELNTQLRIEMLVSDIASGYYDLLRQQSRYENFKNALSLSRERLRITQTQYELGARSKLEVLQAKVDFNTDSSNYVKQRQTVLSTETQLKTAMGSIHSHEQVLQLADSTIKNDKSLHYNELLDKMLESNTSLLTMVRGKNISQLDLKLVRSRSLPYLRLNSGYGYTQTRYGNSSVKINETTGLNYGLTLGVNLFDGFNHQRNKKNAEIDIRNQELAYAELEQKNRADLYEIFNSYENNLNLMNMERQNFLTAKENYEIAMERYKLGSLAGIELREAQLSFQDAEERLLLIQYQTKVDEISLMQISGQALNYL